jgi:predicted amidohydrolase YtcJ
MQSGPTSHPGLPLEAVGDLAPGKLDDLVVLGEDPFALDPDELPAMPVDLTLLGGKPPRA